MLNRRILRVKAFQTLYAYQQCKLSNFNLAHDYIREAFQPDLNSMEVQDKVLLKKNAETCIRLFSESIDGKVLATSGEDASKISDVAIRAMDLFHKSNKKDREFLKKNMVNAVENIPGLYLYAVKILIGFRNHVRQESHKKRKLSEQAVTYTDTGFNLGKNQVLEIIAANHSFEKACARFHVDITDLEQEIKEWYRELVKTNEDYQDYSKIEAPSLEQDNEILQILLKKVVFKSDPILSFFQDRDLNWSENKPIVRSLALKVVKHIDGDRDLEDDLLPDIAINWEEDKEFFQNIFNLTIESEREFSDLIAEKASNWDVERIALTDKVILTMALTEMVNFPSIPIKVTINEYIDISKTYSTPKSKQFVNGLLDTISKELTESGKIRKSGRGLIDNK
ncbi:transcription antitermination factor NusB [Negadavirga shengliensis]|uniref:Transcription antitermination protein NusB n=1 Tax=Negadavirga shengliensis TaxID=1389218 RepID=A0ABV9T0E7_9BACT